MMLGQVAVSELSRREGIGASVLHRWHRQARRAAGLPVATAAQRLVPVRVALPAPSEAARPAAGLEVVLGNGRVLRAPPGADPALVGVTPWNGVLASFGDHAAVAAWGG